MSIVKLTKDKFENFNLVTNPKRVFASSSLDGSTGDVNLFARENRIVKETSTYFSGGLSSFDETVGVEIELISAKNASSGELSEKVQDYLDAVSSESLSTRQNASLAISRVTPGLTVNKNHLKKMAIVNTLMPFYSTRYQDMDFSYTNYSSLNFFTASSVPEDTVLIYPGATEGDTTKRYYHPSGAFSLDLQIKPSPKFFDKDQEFHAGTIMHVSSTFALSIVSGSRKDKNGNPESFRVMLQLSHSADIEPSSIDLTVSNNDRTYPEDLVFLSSDNVLSRDTWHNVVARWGTKDYNEGTGSFVIDSVIKGEFNVPSASIKDTSSSQLYLGNYYTAPPSSTPERFFNAIVNSREGLELLTSGSADPSGFSFSHPLNAEMHDVKVFNSYRTISQILTSSIQGQESVSGMLFYVPVFFTRESPSRDRYITQFEKRESESAAPFNVGLAFQVGGHEINIDNFTRDFARSAYPRQYNLTGTLHTQTSLSTTDRLYSDPAFAKRNLTILPCDNGRFTPNFKLLKSGSETALFVSGSPTERFRSDLGVTDFKKISLRNFISDDVLQTAVSGQLEDNIYGASPEDPTVVVGAVPTVFQRTRDSSSNQVTIFNIPSLFYGKRIKPGSLTIRDNSLSGSSESVQIELRDNGDGSLYRHNASGTNASWNSVGNIFYNEGIVFIKSPHLSFFGKDSFEVEFNGERSIFVSKVNVTSQASMINSSSNPSYKHLSASLNANDEDSEFVYITNIAIHDENLNVVARTNLAQPIVKRSADKVMFKIKMDW